MAELDDRTDDICGQLQRYGGRVANDGLADILEELAEVNDDIWHGRSHDLIVDGLSRAIAACERLRDRTRADAARDLVEMASSSASIAPDYKSDVLSMIHQNAVQLHQHGTMTDDQMRELDRLCLVAAGSGTSGRAA